MLRLQGEDEAVDAYGKADAGGLWAAERFGQAVVASAAEQGVLRAESAVGELEGCAGVVVEAADEARIECRSSRRRRRARRVRRRSAPLNLRRGSRRSWAAFR